MILSVDCPALLIRQMADSLAEEPEQLQMLLAELFQRRPDLRDLVEAEAHRSVEELTHRGPPESVAPLNVLNSGFGGW